MRRAASSSLPARTRPDDDNAHKPSRPSQRFGHHPRKKPRNLLELPQGVLDRIFDHVHTRFESAKFTTRHIWELRRGLYPEQHLPPFPGAKLAEFLVSKRFFVQSSKTYIAKQTFDFDLIQKTSLTSVHNVLREPEGCLVQEYITSMTMGVLDTKNLRGDFPCLKHLTLVALDAWFLSPQDPNRAKHVLLLHSDITKLNTYTSLVMLRGLLDFKIVDSLLPSNKSWPSTVAANIATFEKLVTDKVTLPPPRPRASQKFVYGVQPIYVGSAVCFDTSEMRASRTPFNTSGLEVQNGFSDRGAVKTEEEPAGASPVATPHHSPASPETAPVEATVEPPNDMDEVHEFLRRNLIHAPGLLKDVLVDRGKTSHSAPPITDEDMTGTLTNMVSSLVDNPLGFKKWVDEALRRLSQLGVQSTMAARMAKMSEELRKLREMISVYEARIKATQSAHTTTKEQEGHDQRRHSHPQVDISHQTADMPKYPEPEVLMRENVDGTGTSNKLEVTSKSAFAMDRLMDATPDATPFQPGPKLWERPAIHAQKNTNPVSAGMWNPTPETQSAPQHQVQSSIVIQQNVAKFPGGKTRTNSHSANLKASVSSTQSGTKEEALSARAELHNREKTSSQHVPSGYNVPKSAVIVIRPKNPVPSQPPPKAKLGVQTPAALRYQEPPQRRKVSTEDTATQSTSSVTTHAPAPSSQSAVKQPETKQPEANQVTPKQPGTEQTEIKQLHTEQPKIYQPKIGQPQAAQSETKKSEGQRLEAMQPKAQRSEAKQLDAKQLEAKQPDARQLDAKQSDAKAKHPDAKQLEAKQSDTKEKQPGAKTKRHNATQLEPNQPEPEQLEAKQPDAQQLEPKRSSMATKTPPPLQSAEATKSPGTETLPADEGVAASSSMSNDPQATERSTEVPPPRRLAIRLARLYCILLSTLLVVLLLAPVMVLLVAICAAHGLMYRAIPRPASLGEQLINHHGAAFSSWLWCLTEGREIVCAARASFVQLEKWPEFDRADVPFLLYNLSALSDVVLLFWWPRYDDDYALDAFASAVVQFIFFRLAEGMRAAGPSLSLHSPGQRLLRHVVLCWIIVRIYIAYLCLLFDE